MHNEKKTWDIFESYEESFEKTVLFEKTSFFLIKNILTYFNYYGSLKNPIKQLNRYNHIKS